MAGDSSRIVLFGCAICANCGHAERGVRKFDFRTTFNQTKGPAEMTDASSCRSGESEELAHDLAVARVAEIYTNV